MDKKEHISYWIKCAEHDLDVAQTLFDNEKFDSCLFFSHLCIEKLLKAFWVRDNDNNYPDRTHNLLKLLSNTNLCLSENQKLFLATLNEFNLESRYPDFKLDFYKICDKVFTKEKFDTVKEIYKCILESL